MSAQDTIILSRLKEVRLIYSKQSNQRYRKETGLNHKERAKDAVTITLLKIRLVEKAMRWRFYGFSDNTKKKIDKDWPIIIFIFKGFLHYVLYKFILDQCRNLCFISYYLF